MQLKDKSPLAFRTGLALATSALFGGTAHAEEGWKVDSALLLYDESAGRVQAIEPVLNLNHQNADESSFNLRLVYDSLSGASPNGAARANIVQTFTTASGAARLANSATGSSGSTASTREAEDDESAQAFYDVAAGALPLDPSFEDSRGVISLGWSTPLQNNYALSLGGTYSGEKDFTSYSVNSGLTKDLFNKNTTLSAGLNLEFDTVMPYGGIPDPLTSYGARGTTGAQETKQVVDVIAGITQVMNRRWLSMFNIAWSSASGYQNDPYKILTVAQNGNLVFDPQQSASYLYIFEGRPRDRTKNSFYWQNKIALFSDDVLDMSYRYMQDDWGIKSDTYDVSYHWQLTGHAYIEPHYRHYLQSAADFYTPFLNAPQDAVITLSGPEVNAQYASSDPRLGAFSADTYGLKLGYRFNQDEEISLRLETYQQHDKNALQVVPQGSNLYGQDQFAELSASWIQVGYSFRW
jgi:hypothetical protein